MKPRTTIVIICLQIFGLTLFNAAIPTEKQKEKREQKKETIKTKVK